MAIFTLNIQFMKTYLPLPVLKLQMGTMRQSLGCPGVLDSVGTSIMPIFRYLLFFYSISDWSTGKSAHENNNRCTYNDPPSEVVGYRSDFFCRDCRVTFCWPIKTPSWA